jgi:sulfur-carrier protein
VSSNQHPRLAGRRMIGRMVTVEFTPQLQRFTATPRVETHATTLRGALEAAFAENPRLRGYVLDDQGHLRANVVCFIDGRRCAERVLLADPLQPTSRVHVLQALSGG